MLQASVSYRLAYLYLERSKNSICKWKTKCCCPCLEACVGAYHSAAAYIWLFRLKTHFSNHQVKYSMTPPPFLLVPLKWAVTVCGNIRLIRLVTSVYRTKAGSYCEMALSFETGRGLWKKKIVKCVCVCVFDCLCVCLFVCGFVSVVCVCVPYLRFFLHVLVLILLFLSQTQTSPPGTLPIHSLGMS